MICAITHLFPLGVVFDADRLPDAERREETSVKLPQNTLDLHGDVLDRYKEARANAIAMRWRGPGLEEVHDDEA